MNNIQVLNQNILFQQQLILQQMMMYNHMLQTQMFPAQETQVVVQQSVDKIQANDTLSPKQQSQQEDTHPILHLQQKISKNKKKEPNVRKPKKACDVPLSPQDKSQKKKVFLSMLDIKEANYKLFRLEKEEKMKQAALQSHQI